MCTCLQAMILLASWRPEVWWDGSYDWSIGREGKDAGSLGRTGREEKEVVLHSKTVTSGSAWSSAWIWM